VNSNHAGKGSWKIIDNAGRVLLSGTVTLKKGNNNFSIDINQLSAGAYYLHISGDKLDKYTRFQKL
jgi:hypothetical protein